MSNYKPRHGDRVRVTQSFEGEVVVNEHYFEVVVDGASHSFDWDEVGESGPFAHHFEKIADPLPTTPGSVIRYLSMGQAVRILDRDGCWRATDWTLIGNTTVEAFAAEQGFEVLHDAGKAS